jgi:hypothetical protein
MGVVFSGVDVFPKKESKRERDKDLAIASWEGAKQKRSLS